MTARWSRSQKFLFLLGLALRIPGLCFKGMADVDQFIFQWGAAVWHEGLLKAFAGIYGPFSYLCYAPAAAFAEKIPRFWGLGYKLEVLFFECALFFILSALVRPDRRKACLWMVWLNPWFVIHGTWQGFWDAPHTLFALLAVLCCVMVRTDARRSFWAGVMLAISALFKPQGLFYFLMPVSVYFALRSLKDRSGLLRNFIFGVFSVFFPVAWFLSFSARGWLSIPKNYESVVVVMANLCNEAVNIWRPISFFLMKILGQTGPFTMNLQLPRPTLAFIHAVVTQMVLLSIAAYATQLLGIPIARKLSRQNWRSLSAASQPLANDLLAVMAFSAIVIPQFATKCHINHPYAGLILLIPFTLVSKRFFVCWCVMAAVQGYAHLVEFGLGPNGIHVHQILNDFPWGLSLMKLVNSQAELFSTDPFLKFQAWANAGIARLPREPLFSTLAVIQLPFVLWAVRELFGWARQSGKKEVVNGCP